MHVRSFLTALVLAAVPATFVTEAHAQQVNDADRNAARDLYNEGWALQQQGRYADAAERYTRSLAVFPAPTTAFRQAQCKAALGQLVEGAEELRAVMNATLPANPPEAFIKAKQEAAAELANLEPRIPKLRINVQPSPLQGMQVTIDGVPMSVALVGVARPVNPGTHKIVATAPGYQPAQTSVDVRERQQPMPEVSLVLQPGQAGVQYTVQPNANPNTNPNPNYPYNNGAYGNPSYPYNTWVPPRRHDGPQSSFMLGVDGALSVPFGTIAKSGGGTIDLANDLNLGGGIGFDVGVRLARIIYLGLEAQVSFFGDKSVGPNAGATDVAFSLGGVIGFLSSPENVAFYGEIGGGLRTISVGDSTTLTGDVILGVGIEFKVATFRAIPKINLYVGPNDQFYGHGFFTLGVAIFWDRPLDHPPADPAPTNAAPASPTY